MSLVITLSFFLLFFLHLYFFSFFFFNDTATTEIYTLSLHDALPISSEGDCGWRHLFRPAGLARDLLPSLVRDRKSTRLNSSHGYISYAVFCLKKKKINNGIGAQLSVYNKTRGRRDSLSVPPLARIPI